MTLHSLRFSASFALTCLLILETGAATKHWRGTNSSLASAEANWAENAAPEAGDDIVLDADSASKALVWDLDVSVGSWTQSSDYTGTVTFYTGRAEDETPTA